MNPPSISLLDQPRPDGTVAVKVCGFIEPDGFLAAHTLGVDAVGLNFWPGSKRHVEPATAAAWVAALPAATPEHQVLRVGVFVNPSDEEVLVPWEAGTIHVAQLHGDEPPEQCARLMAAGVPVIKAFGWRGEESLDRALASGTPYLLADAFAPGVYGGTGHTLDWSGLHSGWTKSAAHLRLVLSGGIHPGNAAGAVAAVRPAMIDVASGVESAPGVKDPALIRALLEAVR